jgi:hypothetical protein
MRPRHLAPILAWLAALTGVPARAGGPSVEFNRDVRPILAGACFRCHGPDHAQRKAGLRLDTEEGARADLGGRRAVVPGDTEASELLQRLDAEDLDERMPPVKSGLSLSSGQIETLRQWIAQGATWQPHWSLIAPRRSEPPPVHHPDWPITPLDRFILARLERVGLAPSAPAEPVSLIRRVTFDLTGLPPTPGEVDAFLADPTPEAYERAIDRLLSSPRFGERMARRWLDAARYADTNGYQSDGERTMWRWRDWVIDAYNENKPFDVFTVEQIAGDLLQNPRLDQIIATGFNRNHRGNGEGGIIPEEYAVEYVADRVETTATAWLGLTLLCARCHDHKYDPFTQTDFYRIFAFFNNVPEKGRAWKYGNSPPVVASPTRWQQTALAQLEARLAEADRRFAALSKDLQTAQAPWESGLSGKTGPDPLEGWSDERGRVVDARLRDRNEAGVSFFGSPSLLAEGARFDGQCWAELSAKASAPAALGYFDSFTLAARVRPDDERGGVLLSKLKDEDRGTGYSLTYSQRKVGVNLVQRWLDDAIRVEVDAPSEPGPFSLAVTYDGSRTADGIKVYIDGRERPIRVLLDELNQSFDVTEPFRIGSGVSPDSRFRGVIGDVLVYKRALGPDEVASLSERKSVRQIAAIETTERTHAQAAKIRGCFLERFAPEAIRRAVTNLQALSDERARMIASYPTTMVMQEGPARPAHVLLRGVYDRPGLSVTPGVPSRLPPLPKGAPANRLGLARWLVDPANPLPARVAVNGYWAMLFGTGIVKTAEDFGVQGEPPSHPELLDWLATEFVASGWDVKAIVRLLVTSATYRQSTRVTPGLTEIDPENRLLARGARFRLSGEMIRDQALMAGGLLVERLGGPSVRPYQPEGLWKELTEAAEYFPSKGPDLYRRSLYTFWKRTIAPPFMAAFDANARDRCVVRESRTNTPIQALNLMNDVTFVEAARGLAERVIKSGGPTAEERVRLAFRLATSRPPSFDEQAVLLKELRDNLDHFRAEPAEARGLVCQGESARDPELDEEEVAAYTVVASLVLNLDEALTKE